MSSRMVGMHTGTIFAICSSMSGYLGTTASAIGNHASKEGPLVVITADDTVFLETPVAWIHFHSSILWIREAVACGTVLVATSSKESLKNTRALLLGGVATGAGAWISRIWPHQFLFFHDVFVAMVTAPIISSWGLPPQPGAHIGATTCKHQVTQERPSVLYLKGHGLLSLTTTGDVEI